MEALKAVGGSILGGGSLAAGGVAVNGYRDRESHSTVRDLLVSRGMEIAEGSDFNEIKAELNKKKFSVYEIGEFFKGINIIKSGSTPILNLDNLESMCKRVLDASVEVITLDESLPSMVGVLCTRNYSLFHSIQEKYGEDKILSNDVKDSESGSWSNNLDLYKTTSGNSNKTFQDLKAECERNKSINFLKSKSSDDVTSNLDKCFLTDSAIVDGRQQPA